MQSIIAAPSSKRTAPVQTSPSLYRAGFKRLLDILLVLASSVTVLPVVILMAALVALDGRNPFYSQKRVGRGGRVFRMWKIRTMVPDADRMLQQYLDSDPAALHEWNTTQKLKHDPRITPVGSLLRKTSLDELPQILNVLLGDMSLVGPRPMMLDQQELYPGEGYYRLRPGITGLWQISDRNECAFHERARFDDRYDADLSFGTDVSILMRTVGVVLRGTGY